MPKDGVHSRFNGWAQLVIRSIGRRNFHFVLDRLLDFYQIQGHEHFFLHGMSQPFAGGFNP